MDSSEKSKRKLIPFIPDIPYHIQIVFIIIYSYIWYQAFVDREYLKPLPEDKDAAY